MDRSPTSGRVILLLTRLVDPTSLGFPKKWAIPLGISSFMAISRHFMGEGWGRNMISHRIFCVFWKPEKHRKTMALKRLDVEDLVDWDGLGAVETRASCLEKCGQIPMVWRLVPSFRGTWRCILYTGFYIYIYIYNIHTFMRTTTINKSITIKNNHEQQHLFTPITVPQTNNLTLVIITF